MFLTKCAYVADKNKKLIYPILLFLLAAFLLYCVKYQGTDFYTYFSAAVDFSAGKRVYFDEAYLYYYPPLTAQLISPLTIFPKQIAYLIWAIISCGATFLGIYLLTENKKNFTLYCLISFFFVPVEVTVYAGQVNALLFLSLSVAYYGIKKNNIYWPALGISAGIMLKIIPIANFLHLLWKGKVKISMFIIIFLLLLFIISLPFAGLQGWVDFFERAFISGSTSLPSQGFHGSTSLNFNQAISGLMARFFVDDQTAVKAWHLTSVALIIFTGLVCLPTKGCMKNFDLEFSLVIVAINLVMPYTWYYQLMILLIPIIIILQRVEHDRYFEKLLPFFFLGYVLTNFHGALWHYFNHPILSSFPTFFSIFLWVCLSNKIVSDKIAEIAA